MTLKSSPLLLKYSKILEKDPNSRAFAPLAECYRKLEMIDEAISTLEQGLEKHPDYLIAQISLGACYADKGDYLKAYELLHNKIDDNKENVRLREFFGEVCHKLKIYDEALENYKYLLFLYPRNKDYALKVEELSRSEALSATIKKVEDEPSSELDINGHMLEDLDDAEVTEASVVEQVEDKPTNVFKLDLIDSFSDMEPSNKNWSELDLNTSEKQEDKRASESTIFMTQTLVDLYCEQGHLDKAVDLLDKMAEISPDDPEIPRRKTEIMALLEGADLVEDQVDAIALENVDEEPTQSIIEIEARYSKLLNAIQNRAHARSLHRE